jgi:hypothetical protein
MTSTISSLAIAANFAPAMPAAIASTRADRPPARSPNVSRWTSDVIDLPVVGELHRNEARPAQQPVLAEPSVEGIEVMHAIQQWHDGRVRPYRRCEGFDRTLKVVCLT